MSTATRRGQDAVAWQYHSRSDSHSKVACWAVLFDLLCECDVLRRHAEQGLIGFGINHVMVGPINKTLDLVVTVVPSAGRDGSRFGFHELVERYGIPLNDDEREALGSLPVFLEDTSEDVFEVAIALEAKRSLRNNLIILA